MANANAIINTKSFFKPTPAPVAKSVPQTPTPVTPSTNKRTFLQGNILQKGMDVLQAPESAFAGFMQGGLKTLPQTKALKESQGGKLTGEQKLKSLGQYISSGIKNIPSAIKNRTYLGSGEGEVNYAKEAWKVENPTAQAAVNLGASLALPNIPLGKILGKAGKIVGEIPGVAKTAAKISEKVMSKPAVTQLVETFAPFARNKKFGELLESSKLATNKRVTRLYNTVKEAAKGLSPAEQMRVGQLMEGGVTAIQDSKYAPIAKRMNQLADEIGKEAVDLGLMSKEAFEGKRGEYLSHIWANSTNTGNLSRTAEIPKISGQFFKERKGAAGYMKQFAPATFKGLGTEIKDIEAAKFYKNAAEQFGVKMSGSTPEQLFEAVNKGFKSADDVAQMKNAKVLKGVMVPAEVHDYLIKTMPKKETNFALKAYDGIFNAWKAGKTIWNPAYHVRNLMSNQILSDMSTGRGLARTVADYVGSVVNYFGKGNQSYVVAAEDAGLIKKLNFTEGFNEFLGSAYGLDKKGSLEKAANFLRNFQNTTEETSKLGVFKAWVEKLAGDAGIKAEQALQDPTVVARAVKEAEKAIFSPYKIAESERKMIGRIIPFYSFTRQAVPFVAETALQHPERLAKYPKIQRGIENLNPSERVPEDQRPDYMQGSIQLPFKVNGEKVAFDPTYIYPFGNIGESDVLPFGLNVNPMAQEAVEQKFNKDLFSGNEIKTSNIPGVGADVLSSKPVRAGSQRLAHFLRTAAPSPFRTIQGKLMPAWNKEKDYAGRERGKLQAVFDAIGFKSIILRPEEKRKFDRLDTKNKLQSIKSEMLKIRREKNLSPEDKQMYVDLLRDEMRKESSQR